MITIHAQQENNQPTSTTAATNSPTGTTQSIAGTPLPNATNGNNNNNSSAAANGAGPTNAQSGHGAVMTPSQAAAPHSMSPTSSGGISNTTRPPQVAPFPDDTVGKNGRLRVSSMGSIPTTPSPSCFIILSIITFLFFNLIE